MCASSAAMTAVSLPCKRTFEEHIQLLFEEVGIWRPDQQLLERAETVLALADDSGNDDDDDNAPRNILWEKHLQHKHYCEQKSDFLLDLADEDLDISTNWNQRAGVLWGFEEGEHNSKDRQCHSNTIAIPR